jgi:blocked-early-in-transport protein 1
LTPAGATGDSTLSKRNALLGSSSNGYNSSQTNLNDPDYSYGGHGYSQAGNNISRSSSPFVRPSSSNSAYASQRQAEDLEGQNDEELEGLGAKVKLLKNVR